MWEKCSTGFVFSTNDNPENSTTYANKSCSQCCQESRRRLSTSERERNGAMHLFPSVERQWRESRASSSWLYTNLVICLGLALAHWCKENLPTYPLLQKLEEIQHVVKYSVGLLADSILAFGITALLGNSNAQERRRPKKVPGTDLHIIEGCAALRTQLI